MGSRRVPSAFVMKYCGVRLLGSQLLWMAARLTKARPVRLGLHQRDVLKVASLFKRASKTMFSAFFSKCVYVNSSDPSKFL